jgi:hypothetical protein
LPATESDPSTLGAPNFPVLVFKAAIDIVHLSIDDAWDQRSSGDDAPGGEDASEQKDTIFFEDQAGIFDRDQINLLETTINDFPASKTELATSLLPTLVNW